MRNIYCWWFGCKHDNSLGGPNCARCGGWVDYADLVGDTRHNRMIERMREFWWRITQWWPRYCLICKSRRCDNNADTHLPF